MFTGKVCASCSSARATTLHTSKTAFCIRVPLTIRVPLPFASGCLPPHSAPPTPRVLAWHCLIRVALLQIHPEPKLLETRKTLLPPDFPFALFLQLVLCVLCTRAVGLVFNMAPRDPPGPPPGTRGHPALCACFSSLLT